MPHKHDVAFALIGCAAWLATSVLIGCATQQPTSVSYDSQRDRSVYAMQPINIVRTSGGLGQSGQQIISLKAWATCSGKACEPEQIELRFANAGRNVLWLNYRTITLRAGGERFKWDNVTHRELSHVPVGEFARVRMNRENFLSMLRASELQGSLGSTSFHLSFDQMEPFRDFAVAISPGIDEFEDTSEMQLE